MLPRISFRRITPERLKQLLGLSVRLGILAIAALVAILFASRWDAWVGAHVAQTTDDAYVKGDLTPLSAKVEGYLRKVPINDFQRVKAESFWSRSRTTTTRPASTRPRPTSRRRKPRSRT